MAARAELPDSCIQAQIKNGVRGTSSYPNGAIGGLECNFHFTAREEAVADESGDQERGKKQ